MAICTTTFARAGSSTMADAVRSSLRRRRCHYCYGTTAQAPTWRARDHTRHRHPLLLEQSRMVAGMAVRPACIGPRPGRSGRGERAADQQLWWRSNARRARSTHSAPIASRAIPWSCGCIVRRPRPSLNGGRLHRPLAGDDNMNAERSRCAC
jgi:hypothetical protein